MYSLRALSSNKGWDILSTQKEDVWHSIQESLELLRPEVLKNGSLTNRYGDLNDNSRVQIKELPDVWSHFYARHTDWMNYDTFDKINSTLGFDYVKDVKSKVLVKMVSFNGAPESNLSRMMFVETPRGIRAGVIDLTVLLVPENGVLKLFGNPKEIIYDFPFTETNCREQIKDLLPIPNDIPFVIIFFSQHRRNASINIEELPTVEKTTVETSTIERSLEFAPEYTQAGISILAYFGQVLRDKYPDLKVKVRIEQQQNTVLMHVELPSGEVDIIREELATYFLVVAGKESPENLLDNPYQVIALKTKLEVANMELRMSRELNSQLGSDISVLKQQFAEQGTQMKMLIQLATQQAASHERIQLAQIGHAGIMFSGLLTQAQGNQATLIAIHSLEHNLMSGIALVDIQDQISISLATIKQEKPSLLKHLAGQVESAGFGAAGGFVLDWISRHM